MRVDPTLSPDRLATVIAVSMMTELGRGESMKGFGATAAPVRSSDLCSGGHNEMTDESFRPLARSLLGPKVCIEGTRFVRIGRWLIK